jgi:hypothetical protein
MIFTTDPDICSHIQGFATRQALTRQHALVFSSSQKPNQSHPKVQPALILRGLQAKPQGIWRAKIPDVGKKSHTCPDIPVFHTGFQLSGACGTSDVISYM